MISRSRIPALLRVIAAIALVAAAALLPAGAAQASATQPTMVQDDTELLSGSQQLRDQRLDELKSLGVAIVKVRVHWRGIAPGGNRRPPNFDGRDPNAYPPGAWSAYDAVVAGAQARGMSVFFDLGGDAPLWATGGNHKSAIFQPNAGEFSKFVTAVGRRYPSVHLFSVWNEPNLASWLAPQYKSGVPYSPVIYRALLYAARDGLNASGHGADQLLLGELLPFARSGHEGSTKVRPITFLRELACVDSHYRPYRGKAARLRSCERFKALPGTAWPTTRTRWPAARASPPRTATTPRSATSAASRRRSTGSRQGIA